eukprot:m.55473 g.55473  ORF g.55473 m.55473 type:complete len:336 (-) comp13653_c0_seq5:497-1504(-)
MKTKFTLVQAIAESLSTGVTPEAERYDRVSILFSDIVGFTKISSSVPPCEVMDMLNELFSKFDALCEKYNVFKVETIGDAYMVASGLPVPTPHYADNLAGFAIEMVACAEEVPSPLDGEPLRIRVGMHTGPCMAGVVGRKRPRYCLFGDSVNTASRMESTGVPAAIQVSYAFVKSLTVRDDWNTMSRGIIDVKGKGKMKTHFLLGKKHSPVQLSPPDASETKPVSNVGTPPVMEYGSVCHSPMPLQSVPSSPRLVGGSNFALIDIRSANTGVYMRWLYALACYPLDFYSIAPLQTIQLQPSQLQPSPRKLNPRLQWSRRQLTRPTTPFKSICTAI